MELSKDKAVAFKQVIEVLEQGRADVQAAAADRGNNNGWIVCFENDALPFRKDDKGVISAFGGKLFVANSAHYANSVMLELNQKTTSKNRVVVYPISAWAALRLAVLDKLIDGWKQQAAEQGITL